MGKITFILGGTRSGKSQFAVELAKAKRTAFIATCQPRDSEMRERVLLHKKTRPAHWKTFQEPQNVSSLIENISDDFEFIVIDCLTLLVSNLQLRGYKKESIEEKINKILFALKAAKARSIIVSNEVGLGIVPQNKLARNFRDIAGRINQITAAKSNKVFFMVSGIPWRIK